MRHPVAQSTFFREASPGRGQEESSRTHGGRCDLHTRLSLPRSVPEKLRKKIRLNLWRSGILFAFAYPVAGESQKCQLEGDNGAVVGRDC